MTDYIKREDAIVAYANHEVDVREGKFDDYHQYMRCVLRSVESVDVAPVRHGHWIFNQDEMSLHCSYCDEVFRFEDAEKDECLDFMEYAKYCLACGTRMDGEEDDA